MSSHKCLTYVLCLGAVVFTLAPAQGTNPNHPNQQRRVELQRALASFASWAKKYATKSGTITGSRAVDEGVSLAKQRRAALRELIQSDPASALDSLTPSDLRKLLPEAITSELETPVYGTGDLLVACVMPAQGKEEAAEIQRFVRLDGHTYHAYVYGRRLAETTKFKIPLHGVVLDGVLALKESVLSELDTAQAAEINEPVVDVSTTGGTPGTGPARLARLGKTIYRFASLEQLQRCEAMLEKAESDSPAEPDQPAAELLERGFPAKPVRKESNHPLVAPFPIKKVLIIRADFSDVPGDPYFPGLQPFTAESVQAIADTQIGPYYKNSSYGKIGMAFTVTPKVYRLPQTAATYATMDYCDSLHGDAVAAANEDYPGNNYDVVIVLFSFLGAVPGSQIGFGGLTLVGTSTVWVNGEFDFRVVAHELGHTFGLNHANLWKTNDGNPISDTGYSVEYGDVFDTMGANWSYDRRVDFNPWFKYMLNWITDDQVQTITSNGLYRVYRFDDSAATGTLALRIAKDQDRDYWIGCRRNFADNQTLSHGAYVLWGYHYPRQSDLLCLGQAPNDARNAALPLGASFADPEANLTFTVVDEGGTAPAQYIDLQVTFAPPPPPVLHMSVVAGQIVLSWPASASNFTLESCSDLSAGGSWTAVTAEPAVVGRSLVLTNDLQSPVAFYRLHSR
jgi:hypothetical protein